ncbi:MAG: hypothetical protein ABI700_03270 [Chloroflexota bacterium]
MHRLYSPSLRYAASHGSKIDFSMSWKVFVNYVLDITVEAYEKMRNEAQLYSDYGEETLSAILAEDYIEAISNNHPQMLQLRVHVEVPIHTPAMTRGSEPVAIRKARKIDIQLYGSWDREYRRRYFAWECKKISDRETNSNLITEYVSEGIYRYCDNEYSAEMGDAGMIGYVLAGGTDAIVAGINDSMVSLRRERALPPDEQLLRTSPIQTLEHVFESTHYRVANSSRIHLYHLFLAFNWVTTQPILDVQSTLSTVSSN